jgi:hypothetical protein
MTAAATDKETRYAGSLAKLAAGRAEEKEARRLRREGRDEEAVDTYDRARSLYADTDFAYQHRTDSDEADEAQRAIQRCDSIVRNIRHPKTQRAPAVTPRPNCLACGKPLRRYKQDGRTFDDGTPQEWGDYGDNRFCGLTCGWRWACRHAPMPVGAKGKK